MGKTHGAILADLTVSIEVAYGPEVDGACQAETGFEAMDARQVHDCLVHIVAHGQCGAVWKPVPMGPIPKPKIRK